ncbi:LysR substrate-binding domain-containing protein [Janthinobacterium sp. LB3P118]|uniref:LysR substrate-binding domain-containing protein n=1 Tax=Janthinobacterium sp. LB3P118 TaxID=3424195 RepID=UPI003F1F99B7
MRDSKLAKVAPTGKLCITAPLTFGAEALMPAMAVYLERYPEVSIDVALSDRVVDLPDRYRSPQLRSFVDFLMERFN